MHVHTDPHTCTCDLDMKVGSSPPSLLYDFFFEKPKAGCEGFVDCACTPTCMYAYVCTCKYMYVHEHLTLRHKQQPGNPLTEALHSYSPGPGTSGGACFGTRGALPITARFDMS